ncbi:hypothetical protein GF337_11430 [candidate division KSB1 bacterium]|nr:hypothetical protein [candidate division KSB1 bacterium]
MSNMSWNRLCRCVIIHRISNCIMLKHNKIHISVFHALIILLTFLSLVPLIILISLSLSELNNVKNLSNETSELIVKDQTAQICKTDAEHLARRITEFLKSCENDLNMLSQLPMNSLSYHQFSNQHFKWVSHLEKSIPLYKEISYIDKNGTERVKIIDNKIVPEDNLQNVNIPANTSFKTENYFDLTRKSPGGYFISHLNGWYVSRNEQLEQGKSYHGVFRFCKRITDEKDNFKGICMIALDHHHILNFISKNRINKENVLKNYQTGNYDYIIDDEGWIIAHQKLWDIRGLDKDGNLIAPLTADTPHWRFDAGIIPINLFEMDWRLHDLYSGEPISSIIKRVQRGETVITTMKSMGIYGESEGIMRTRAISPIFYNTGDYSKHGIWGGVVIGTSMDHLLDKTKSFTAQIENISGKTRARMLMIASIISLAVILFSFFAAKITSRSIKSLNNTLTKIGEGDFTDPVINFPIKELKGLSLGVKRLANELKAKNTKINEYIKELEFANVKLAEAQSQLDTYWKHEYEIESAQVLEEKIETYEKDYPRLSELRQNICTGNSPPFLRVLRQIVPLSQMTIPAWIYGESGVGKTALARMMHLLSPRCHKPFHIFEAVEFSAADPMIVLGKLFGFGPGHGIQGIDKNGQQGVLEECNGGTLVIDDVDALPLDTQAQLLRVVDGLSFHPAAGKSRDIVTDIRFIFVTNVNLEQRVKEGLFRKDLFRRMGGSINKIEIPPLRERISDIPFLLHHFIDNYNAKHQTQLKLNEETLHYLKSHDYSEGNIGELRMIIQLACESARIEGETDISKTHLPPLSNDSKFNNNIVEKNQEKSEVFTDKESHELSVLRKNLFRMEISEQQLGFRAGSRTLSHHLRGMCLKALKFSDWDINSATHLITNTVDSNIKELIEIRIKGYIKNIQTKAFTSQENTLSKNMPKEYHQILKSAIDHYGYNDDNP